jgi:hypothetical protein
MGGFLGLGGSFLSALAQRNNGIPWIPLFFRSAYYEIK